MAPSSIKTMMRDELDGSERIVQRSVGWLKDTTADGLLVECMKESGTVVEPLEVPPIEAESLVA